MLIKECYEKALPDARLNVDLFVRSIDYVGYCVVYITKSNESTARINLADLRVNFDKTDTNLLAGLGILKERVESLLKDLGFNFELKDMEAVL